MGLCFLDLAAYQSMHKGMLKQPSCWVGACWLSHPSQEVQRIDLKGLPKINAEKVLNLLCACNLEQPHLFCAMVGQGEPALTGWGW
jgi:hypothetical protein